MKEIWKDVRGYEGLYEVSNLGRVRSLGRTVPGSYGSVRRLKTRFVVGSKSAGYRCIHLCDGPRRSQRYVHDLVSEAFIGPRPEGNFYVNHKDGDKLNNELTNLEYCSPTENIVHAFATGLRTDHGECHRWAKLSDADVIWIRVWADEGFPTKVIANAFGVGRHAVRNIVCGRRRRYQPK